MLECKTPASSAFPNTERRQSLSKRDLTPFPQTHFPQILLYAEEISLPLHGNLLGLPGTQILLCSLD